MAVGSVGRPREFKDRRRIALDMEPADILRLDEYAIINGISRVKAINLLTKRGLELPYVQQRLAQTADLSIPEPQSQLAPADQVETGQIETSKPSWLRKLSL
jgi:hypothetical protein